MALTISNNGINLIKTFEGCRLTAYQDSANIWTIGYGHTSGVTNGQIITQEQADAYLKEDCTTAERAINSYANYNWNQNQFDALVSFTFNCGTGNLKTLTANGTRTISEISAKIAAYNKADGKVLQGLIKRRTAEKELFDKAVSAGSSTTISTSTSTTSATTSYTHKDFIKEVQTAIGAKVDGIAGNETLSKTITVSKLKNNKHAVVKPLQKYFNSIGFDCGAVDGIAGRKFDTSVRAYQKANGCVVDGEITAKAATWKKLLKLNLSGSQ